MINQFDESIVLLDNKFTVNQFWQNKIHELYSDREKGEEYEREIIELCPSLNNVLEEHNFELKDNHRLFNLSLWDSNDANPIYYGFVPKSYRAIRIIQRAPVDKTNQLSAWVEKCHLDFNEISIFDASEAYELVIYIEVNQLTFRYAMLLIYFWISRRGVRKIHEELLIKTVYDIKIRGEHSLD
ncbi:hypothetical protein ACNQ05_09545 [Enterobacter cloacae complex sp.6701062]|uniref:hypothetical protein n=1 Tax=Enterobacter cloacae complex TaxID=354276 RepID=UPI000735AE23|nr:MULTISPECIES: hypothetical protein [Enterobacter cloacae complex]KTI49845.1 hypothetical protein ASV05_00925 [Enterobacter hormaechei subsp. xiangfangensis]MCG0549039.1 hypothetical protein [Enterobacter hormaechei]MCG0553596.1 hypothetical protein [Enterobacter hormaechei]MDJ1450024.1 hypothetical protein [Enterobacter hormaechei subsp. xiangfangensis]MDS0081325.1 hypothetical protein [Enterobacter hormaechei subsp. xiangfangensis]